MSRYLARQSSQPEDAGKDTGARPMTTKQPRQRRELVDEHVVAATLGVPVQSLRDARARRIGELAQLGYFKLGKRVRYDATEVERFIEEHRVPFTREEG
jgi:hypothetical protein